MKNLSTKLKKISTINCQWLPIKTHYFFLYGAIAGVLPFLPVYGQDLGLSATAIGITYTLLPISIFLLKPLFGLLADYLQNIKIIVMILTITIALLLIGFLFLKPISNNEEGSVGARLRCFDRNNTLLNLPFILSDPCLRSKIRGESTNCEILYKDSIHKSSGSELKMQVVGKLCCSSNETENGVSTKNDGEGLNSPNCFLLLEGDSASVVQDICTQNESSVSFLNCDEATEECLLPKSTSDLYSTYQFWLFTLLVVGSVTATNTVMSLSDVACCGILGEQKIMFGRQRLWGTVGNGVITLCTGLINDLASTGESSVDYSSGFIIMSVLFLFNLVLLMKIDFPKANTSKNIISDIKKVFKLPAFIIYGISVFVIGNFTGLIANYLFWYLKELGASQTLLGSAMAVQCLLGEVPFFFFSGWFIKHLGYFNCLTCSFAAFALRFGTYFLLENPWLTLPAEALHGITFAVAYSSKTAFAAAYAPPGAEGAILGIVTGISDGLGFASGSLLGGLAFDRIGGSRTFLIASFLSLACIPLTFMSHFKFKEHGANLECKK